MLATALVSQSASAQAGHSALSIVGLTNDGYIYSLDQEGSGGSPVTASSTHTFTGLDGNNVIQSMTFDGLTQTSADYGSLHSYTTATATNTYYNAANSPYADHDGNLNDPNGSPQSLTCLGFAFFNDTLQFGGNIQAGYKARYIFHIDGTNSGTGGAADLSVNVDSNPGDAFFDFDPGFIDTTWATHDFDIDGATPQQISVQFSNQVVFNLDQTADGSNLAGTSDFSSTATLADIEVVDQNGDYVTGWNVTSASGTVYTTMAAVPEPGTLSVLFGIVPLAVSRWRRRKL